MENNNEKIRTRDVLLLVGKFLLALLIASILAGIIMEAAKRGINWL